MGLWEANSSVLSSSALFDPLAPHTDPAYLAFFLKVLWVYKDEHFLLVA